MEEQQGDIIVGGGSTGIVTGGGRLSSGVIVTINPDEENPSTGSGTGTGTNPQQQQPETQTPVLGERETVLERIRTVPDLDPSARTRILKLAAQRPSLTAQDLRVMLATCLYPTAQGLPAPEGYEYFLAQIEKGETVTGALTNAKIYFEADKAQSSPSDPNAPDSQDTLTKQGKLVVAGIVAFIALIFFNR